MSVIENALQKLRRRSESLAGAAAVPRAPHEIGKPTSSLAVAPHSLVPPGHPSKRIAVNLSSLRTSGYLPSDEQGRRLADQYRKIKRPLIERAFAANSTPGMRLIVVSSPLPGDGKTFTTINLALSMARERDLSVLLIDADVPKGRVSQVFGLRNEPGLMDALLNESLDVESLVVRTDIHGLDLLPGGRAVENATELLASARMAQIAARIAAHNPRRIALIDSSPLLASSEADALVRLPGQIVLVVRASATPRQAVLDAIAHVDQNKLQGLILNQAPPARGAGYYYGYSDYGSGGSETDHPVEPKLP